MLVCQPVDSQNFSFANVFRFIEKVTVMNDGSEFGKTSGHYTLLSLNLQKRLSKP